MVEGQAKLKSRFTDLAVEDEGNVVRQSNRSATILLTQPPFEACN